MTDCIETNLSPRACLLRKCPLVFVSRISLNNKNKKIVKHSKMKTNLEKPDIYPLNIWRTIIRQLGTIVCAFMMTWWLNLTKQLLVYYFNFTFNNSSVCGIYHKSQANAFKIESTETHMRYMEVKVVQKLLKKKNIRMIMAPYFWMSELY